MSKTPSEVLLTLGNSLGRYVSGDMATANSRVKLHDEDDPNRQMRGGDFSFISTTVIRWYGSVEPSVSGVS